ncbi:OsmC family protein [Metallumcola ferriviriculae]|uniref:OsmC family protein n=1 Tax=Metallumcola ferriviriculae TaxID=3039180 RepID=A0AAU0UN48_9FIRM|nr:OsmC family protein [Desulfitibacteraceae bacterium MK1]
MTTTVQWKGNMAFEGKTPSGHKILLDPTLNEEYQAKGPSPMEVVLVALGGCSGIDVVSIFEKMRLDVTDFKIEIEAARADEHPKVYNKIKMVYRVWGENLSEDRVKRAVDLTQEKYCSVLHMLNKTASVEYSYQINP